jgi:uncharacterized protein
MYTMSKRICQRFFFSICHPLMLFSPLYSILDISQTSSQSEENRAMPESRQEFPLEQQLRKDIQDAQRARDQLKLDTLRMALGAIHNLEVARTDRKNPEHGQPLTEADCLRALEQEAKKRQQAIPFYQQAGRNELVEREQRELDILQAYLQGSPLSDDDLRTVVTRLIEANGKEFRRVMPLAAKETKGRANGARVQQIVREMTQ